MREAPQSPIRVGAHNLVHGISSPPFTPLALMKRDESEPVGRCPQLERSYPKNALLSNRGCSLNNNLRKKRENRALGGLNSLEV